MRLESSPAAAKSSGAGVHCVSRADSISDIINIWDRWYFKQPRNVKEGCIQFLCKLFSGKKINDASAKLLRDIDNF